MWLRLLCYGFAQQRGTAIGKHISLVLASIPPAQLEATHTPELQCEFFGFDISSVINQLFQWL